jgi:hypothetical protein
MPIRGRGRSTLKRVLEAGRIAPARVRYIALPEEDLSILQYVNVSVEIDHRVGQVVYSRL